MLLAEYYYLIYDKEMLVIVRAFEEWKIELTGITKRFKVLIDHRALEYFITKRKLNSR